MNIVLRVLAAIVLTAVFLPLAAVNHMDLITSMNGEFEGSQFGHRVLAMDFNGDSYDDLIVYSLYWTPNGVYSDTQRWGKLYFYWGGPGFDNVPDFVIEAQTNKQLGGYIIENGGDINGDGIDDLVMPKYDAPDNYIAVYFGSANPSPTSDLQIPILLPDDGITYPYPLGDINGDGHADMALRIPEYENRPRSLWIWTGDNNNLTFMGEYTNEQVINSLSGVGDVNNDGYDDYLLHHGLSGGTNLNSRIVLYYGSPNFPQVDSLVITENSQQVLGSMGGCALGDVNQDGYADFSAYNGRIWFGGANITATPNLTLAYSTQYHQWSSLTYNSGPDFIHGDLNDDGFQDVIASNAYINYYSGEVGIWVGGPNMNGGCDLYLYPPPDYETRNFGLGKAAGDFNGDGICDLAVSAPKWGTGTSFLDPGTVLVYSGNAQIVSNEDLVEQPIVDTLWTVNLYPNPIQQGSELNIDFCGEGYKEAKQISLDIYNLKGQKVQNACINSPVASYRVPNEITSSLGSGLYFLSVKSEGKPVFSKKLCITK